MGGRSRRSWKVWESRSPEPSSIRSATILPTPGLSPGSWVAPPPKAYSIAISGTVASCTNQASMPPGETRCWILVAACEEAIGISAKPRAATHARCRAQVLKEVWNEVLQAAIREVLGEEKVLGEVLECITSASPRALARCL